MFNIFAWTLSLVSIAIVSQIAYPDNVRNSSRRPLEIGFYFAWSRVVWSISVCYIIFACVNNYGGFVNWFLAHPFWKPISRLSYSIYLTHYIVIHRIFWMKTSPQFSGMTVVCCFLFDIQ